MREGRLIRKLSMAVAALVIGRPDFSGYCSNNGGISASSLNGASGVAGTIKRLGGVSLCPRSHR